jgi:hypothetical protein
LEFLTTAAAKLWRFFGGIDLLGLKILVRGHIGPRAHTSRQSRVSNGFAKFHYRCEDPWCAHSAWIIEEYDGEHR